MQRQLSMIGSSVSGEWRYRKGQLPGCILLMGLSSSRVIHLLIQ